MAAFLLVAAVATTVAGTVVHPKKDTTDGGCKLHGFDLSKIPLSAFNNYIDGNKGYDHSLDTWIFSPCAPSAEKPANCPECQECPGNAAGYVRQLHSSPLSSTLNDSHHSTHNKAQVSAGGRNDGKCRNWWGNQTGKWTYNPNEGSVSAKFEQKQGYNNTYYGTAYVKVWCGPQEKITDVGEFRWEHDYGASYWYLDVQSRAVCRNCSNVSGVNITSIPYSQFRHKIQREDGRIEDYLFAASPSHPASPDNHPGGKGECSRPFYLAWWPDNGYGCWAALDEDWTEWSVEHGVAKATFQFVKDPDGYKSTYRVRTSISCGDTPELQPKVKDKPFKDFHYEGRSVYVTDMELTSSVMCT